MKVFGCQICGYAYLGEEKPTRCPFCGVYEKHIAPLPELREYGKIEGLPEHTIKDLHKALRLEYEDKFHYECGKENAGNKVNRLIMDQLSKHERRHAHAIEEILGIEKDSVEVPRQCIGVEPGAKNFEEQVFDIAIEREREAIEFYNKIAKESDHPRIRELFYALSEVEYEHSLLAKVHS